MIYGLLIGICIASLFSIIANKAGPVPPYKTYAEVNGNRDMVRVIAVNTFTIALFTLVGLLIRGS